MTKHKQLNPKEDDNKIMPISRRGFLAAAIAAAGMALTATDVESAERIVIPKKDIRYFRFRNADSLFVNVNGRKYYISDEFPPNGPFDDRPNYAQISEEGSELRVYRGEKKVEPLFGGPYRGIRDGFVDYIAKIAKQIIKGEEPGKVTIEKNYGSNSGFTAVIKGGELIITAFDHEKNGITDSLEASLLNNKKYGNILTIPVGHNLPTVKKSIEGLVAFAKGDYLKEDSKIQVDLGKVVRKLRYL